MSMTNSSNQNAPDLNSSGSLQEKMGKAGKELSALAHSTAEDIGNEAGRLARGARHQAGDLIETVRHNVREKPTMTLGIAAGAGILVGMLLAARR